MSAAAGNGVAADGRAQQPSGAWSYAFFSPAKSSGAVVQSFNGLISLVEAKLNPGDAALEQTAAAAMAKWPLDTDSPRWYSDAGWGTPRDVELSNIQQFHLKIFHCPTNDCAAEDLAVVASNSGTPTNQSVQVELFPTYRVLSSGGGNPDGGAGPDMALKTCNRNNGTVDCGGPNCDSTGHCVPPLACATDDDCFKYNHFGSCNTTFHQCWESCTENSQCNQPHNLICNGGNCHS